MMFFASWQLWEKLTFVLAMSLVSVFLAGYVKLWWITKKVRRHELEDEEKNTRIREMQESGHGIQAGAEIVDIPFGVRAIEKGVEVPGVWINKNSRPIPEHQRIGRYVKRKSDASELSTSSRPRSTISPIPVMKGGRRASSAYGLSASTSDIVPSTDGDEVVSRRTYKPKYSSQLRYSSYNGSQYDPTTLGQLEGNIAARDGVQVRHPRGAAPITGRADNPSSFSLAENTDNERSSDSSESSNSSFVRGAPSASPIRSPYSSAQAQYSDSYFAVPTPHTPGSPAANPFATPDQTPSGSETSSKYTPTPTAYDTAAESLAGESAYPLLQSGSRSLFPEKRNVTFDTSLEHTNQATRHVNPGFSVLPAGTFTKAAEAKGKEVEHPAAQISKASQSSEKRKSNRLQKKGRFSMTGPRKSDDLR